MATVIGTWSPRTCTSRLPSGWSRPAEVRCHRDEAVGTPDDAGHGHADPDLGVRRRSPGANDRRASSARSSTIATSDEWPRCRSIRTCSRISPPSPTSAAARESTSMSRARTTAPSGAAETSGEGRPGVPRRAAGRSDTRPPATSSPIRPRIALRVRPVRADEGGSGHRSGRMQFADDRAQVRPADGLAAESGFIANGGHGDLCSSCSNGLGDCTTLRVVAA